MSRKVQINKGTIQDNALKALVKSNLFRHKIERNKKGKGSDQRKAKHIIRWCEKPDNKISVIRDFIIGLFSIRLVCGIY